MTLTFFELKGRVAGLAAAALLLTACEGKPGDTDGATETSPGSTSTGTTSEGPTTGTADTTDTDTGGTMGGTSTTSPTTGEPGTSTMGGQTTADATTTTSAGTTTDTGTGTTGGPTDEDLAEACLAACEKFFACIDNPPFPNVEACMNECGMAAGEEASCVEAYTALNNCLAGLDCPQFEDAFVNEEFGPCTDEFEALDGACPVCEGFGGGGPDGCSIGQQCSNQPLQEYVCEGDTCTCMVDGQAQKSCPADGFCALGFEAQAEAANSCCGFDF